MTPDDIVAALRKFRYDRQWARENGKVWVTSIARATGCHPATLRVAMLTGRVPPRMVARLSAVIERVMSGTAKCRWRGREGAIIEIKDDASCP